MARPFVVLAENLAPLNQLDATTAKPVSWLMVHDSTSKKSEHVRVKHKKKKSTKRLMHMRTKLEGGNGNGSDERWFHSQARLNMMFPVSQYSRELFYLQVSMGPLAVSPSSH